MGNHATKCILLSTAHKVWQIFIYTQRGWHNAERVCTYKLSFSIITLTARHASFSLDTSKQLPYRLLYQCADGAWWQIGATDNEKNANMVWTWIYGTFVHSQSMYNDSHSFHCFLKKTCIHR